MKRRRLSDKAYVIRDRETFATDTQFYVSRKWQKKYSGNIVNEGQGDFRVFLESTHGYFSFPRTLPPGEVLEFQDYPLSGITFRGQGIFTLVAWASDSPVGYVRTTAQRTVLVGNIPVGPFNVNVLNFPAVYPASQSGAWSVAVNNWTFPVSQDVIVTRWGAVASAALTSRDISLDLALLQPAAATGTLADVVGNGATQQLGAAACKAVVIRALAASTTTARIGDVNTGVARGAELSPGDAIVLAVANVNLVYFYGAATVTVSITYVN